MPRLGFGLLLLAMAPIVVVLALRSFAGYDARAASSLSLILLLVVLALTMKFSGVFGGFLHCMIPRKRGATAEEDSSDRGGDSNGTSPDGRSAVKKRRIGAGESAAKKGGENSGAGAGEEREQLAVSMANLRDANSVDIDEDLHSRQLAVYGRDTMRRLFASKVLVSGMQGLGDEIGTDLENLGLIKNEFFYWNSLLI